MEEATPPKAMHAAREGASASTFSTETLEVLLDDGPLVGRVLCEGPHMIDECPLRAGHTVCDVTF